MIQYPIQFNSETQAQNGVNTHWKTRSKYETTAVSIPPEFLGPGGAFSPEDLFNHALANCFVATFKVYAENSKLNFENLKVETCLTVDLDENKKPIMKEFHLTAHIIGASHPDKAKFLAKKASQAGFILNSVKTICHFEFILENEQGA